jgi:hypothetical protein
MGNSQYELGDDVTHNLCKLQAMSGRKLCPRASETVVRALNQAKEQGNRQFDIFDSVAVNICARDGFSAVSVCLDARWRAEKTSQTICRLN